MRAISIYLAVACAISPLLQGTAQADWLDDYVREQVPSALRAAVRDYYQARFPEALTAIEGLLASETLTESERHLACLFAGYSCFGMGNVDKTQEWFREALTISPGYMLDVTVTPEKIVKFYTLVQRAMPAPKKARKTSVWLAALGGLALLLALAGGGGGGPGPATVEGQVLDQETLQAVQPEQLLFGSTAAHVESGQYTVSLAPGTYTITCIADGYTGIAPDSIDIPEGPSGPINQDLYLSKDPPDLPPPF